MDSMVLVFEGVPDQLPADVDGDGDGGGRVTIPALVPPSKEELDVDGAIAEAGVRVSKETMPPQLYEAVKSTWVATGGNVSRTANMHDLAVTTVRDMAAKDEWPVYGDGYTSVEKQSKGQLENAAERLYRGWTGMLESMEVETKAIDDIADKRRNSVYVEPLTARNAAFRDLFDRWLKVMERLEPEVFGDERVESVTVEGIDRALSEFVSGIVVGVADRYRERELEREIDVVDAEVVDVSD